MLLRGQPGRALFILGVGRGSGEPDSGLDLGALQVSPPKFPILKTFVFGNWRFWETS